ncbi:MAG: hypothetical protein V1867_01945 [Candidatus Falkowbacteria bacterium]
MEKIKKFQNKSCPLGRQVRRLETKIDKRREAMMEKCLEKKMWPGAKKS